MPAQILTSLGKFWGSMTATIMNRYLNLCQSRWTYLEIWRQNRLDNFFMKTFPEISKVATASKDGKCLIEESINCLFNLSDPDKDGFVDSLELGIGLTNMFTSKRIKVDEPCRISIYLQQNGFQQTRSYLFERCIAVHTCSAVLNCETLWQSKTQITFGADHTQHRNLYLLK